MLAVSDTLLLLAELSYDKNVDVCTFFGAAAAAAAGVVLVVILVWKDLCNGPSFLGDLALAVLVFSALPISATPTKPAVSKVVGNL